MYNQLSSECTTKADIFKQQHCLQMTPLLCVFKDGTFTRNSISIKSLRQQQLLLTVTHCIFNSMKAAWLMRHISFSNWQTQSTERKTHGTCVVGESPGTTWHTAPAGGEVGGVWRHPQLHLFQQKIYEPVRATQLMREKIGERETEGGRERGMNGLRKAIGNMKRITNKGI